MTEGAYVTDEVRLAPPVRMGRINISYNPFSIPLATKDATHAINLASASGALKITQAIIDHMDVRTEAGLEFDSGNLK